MLAIALVISPVILSLKYSISLLPLILINESTAIVLSGSFNFSI